MQADEEARTLHKLLERIGARIAEHEATVERRQELASRADRT